MGLKTFLSAAFNAGTLAANTVSEGLNALSGLTTEIGNTVADFQKSSDYERKKEQALERMKTDLYYAKELKRVKEEMRKAGVTDLNKVREQLKKIEDQLDAEEGGSNLDEFLV